VEERDAASSWRATRAVARGPPVPRGRGVDHREVEEGMEMELQRLRAGERARWRRRWRARGRRWRARRRRRTA